MLSVAQAQRIVLQTATPLHPVRHALDPSALGLVLAEDIASDLDMPPYDKAMMDGYAIRGSDMATGTAVLTVQEEITAGKVPRLPVRPGVTARIMTGAPIPEEADVVVPVERTQLLSPQQVEIKDRPPRPGQHIMRRACEMHKGETVLRTGAVLRPAEMGLLAAVGRDAVRLHPAPRVAILCTGDELVEAPRPPGPGQIRNSNGPMLTALAAAAGGVPRYLGIASDTTRSLKPLIADGLSSDILVLAGGVSAGKLDLVPGALEELGVASLFHKVEMKPGKPVLFGTRDATLVFGLPGNPVSALVCFGLFVRPAMRRLAGHSNPQEHIHPAILAEDFTYRTDRPTYHPALVELTASGWQVRPVPWSGSPDLRGLTRANAFVLFEPNEELRPAGRKYMVLRMDFG